MHELMIRSHLTIINHNTLVLREPKFSRCSLTKDTEKIIWCASYFNIYFIHNYSQIYYFSYKSDKLHKCLYYFIYHRIKSDTSGHLV